MHRNVLFALLGLLLLVVLCPYCRAPVIEDDIRTRSAAELSKAGFDVGQLSVSGRDVTLAGLVDTEERQRSLEDVAEGVWGVRRVHNLLEIAPSVARDFVPGTLWFVKSGPRLTMRGGVPDDDVAAALLAEAHRVWGDANVANELSVDASLDRSGWPDWLGEVVDALHLRRGDLTVKLSGTSATIEGTVLSELTKQRILGAAEVILPEGFDLIDRITVREPENQFEALQARLDVELAGKVVEFDSDSAELTPTGSAVLDEVVAILKENTGRVQIAGHTDSQASPEYNLELSRRRAEAVRDYLMDAGLDRDRFVTVGYGETRPVASNATEEGRQENRRTEFHVLEEN